MITRLCVRTVFVDAGHARSFYDLVRTRRRKVPADPVSKSTYRGGKVNVHDANGMCSTGSRPVAGQLGTQPRKSAGTLLPHQGNEAHVVHTAATSASLKQDTMQWAVLYVVVAVRREGVSTGRVLVARVHGATPVAPSNSSVRPSARGSHTAWASQ